MTSRLNLQVRLPPAVVDLALIGVLLLLRIYAGWMEWIDPIVDFGRELYVPWRITEGAALYRDIAWFSGPLSAYTNAAAFAIGGVSITTLVVTNILVCVTTMALLYLVIREIASRLAAIAAALAFVFLFSNGPILGLPLFNWMAPYSHDLTHGFTIALGGVLFALKFAQRPRASMLIACGPCCGLAFLTKPEIFIALLLAAASAIGLTYFQKRQRPPARWLMFFAGATIAPMLLAILLLTLAMPMKTAASGVFGGWQYLFDSHITGLHFYQWLRGTDDPGLRFADTGKAALGMVAVFAIALTAAFLVGPRLTTPRAKIIAVTALVAVSLLALMPVLVQVTPGHLEFAAPVIVPWLELINPHWRALRDGPIPQPFPFLLAGLAVLHLMWLLRGRAGLSQPRLIARLTALIFALAMLAKVIFYVRFEHYSFVLNVAATAIVIAALLDWLPSLLPWPNASIVFTCVMGLAIAVMVGGRCPASGLQREAYGTGADTFYASPKNKEVRDAVAFLRGHTSPRDSVAVLPEGVMINYLARRANPTPYVNTLPPESLMYGAGNMLAGLQSHPPDYIVLVHRATEEYGVPLFGKDYAQELFAWVRANYRTVETYGQPPLQQPKQRFGIEILQRIPPGEVP